jgi:hypothetical protein
MKNSLLTIGGKEIPVNGAYIFYQIFEDVFGTDFFALLTEISELKNRQTQITEKKEQTEEDKKEVLHLNLAILSLMKKTSQKMLFVFNLLTKSDSEVFEATIENYYSFLKEFPLRAFNTEEVNNIFNYYNDVSKSEVESADPDQTPQDE